MAVILVASAGGSPGATTTSLGVALHWPRDVLLADCDRHPNQAVLAGYLRGLPAGGRGLSGLAQGYRTQETGTLIRLVDQSVPLEQHASRRRLFLPGFTHPRAALLFDRYWSRFATQLDDLSASHTDVVLDCGRLPADGLPEALVRVAQVVVLVTRSDLPALAALRLQLPDLASQASQSAAELQLAVVGGGRPYPAAEISSQLELPLLADLPFDPVTAAMLHEGAPTPKRLTERPLWRALNALAMKLATAVAVTGVHHRGSARREPAAGSAR